MNSYESVADFYAGRSIFITGGSGYLGKAIIEKLLYSCTEINKVYVLIRDKRGASAQERIRQMTTDAIFTRIKDKCPEVLDKIIPIIGDICAPNMGIAGQDEHALLEEVSVVIHSAATVRFDEPLEVAMNTNVEGTQKVLNLCRRMKNIEVFVHISTTYANTHEAIIEEIVYPPPAELDDVYEFIKKDDYKDIERILNGKPNTYTFTKALAESYVERNHGDIRTIILRPSIVSAAVSEPLVGWVDNWFGGTSILDCVGKGFCRSLYGYENNIMDLIPVDYVSNLTLVAAAKCHRFDNLTVLNCSSSSANPVTLEQLCNWFIKENVKDGSSKCNAVSHCDVNETQVAVEFDKFLYTYATSLLNGYLAICQKKTYKIFTRIKDKCPEVLDKIIPIIGDICAPNMGIAGQDEHALLEEVSVVIHSAATVRFDEPLEVAMNTNVEGTQKVLNLCRRMKNIEVFVHISTTYANTHEAIIEEIVYPPPAELDDVYEFIKKDDYKDIERILNGKPNTYTFTKALAESYVERNHGDIRTIILRPSIVSAAVSEPLVGWVDNWFGGTSILDCVGKGFCRSLYGYENNIMDLIPVDYVSNLTLVAAAKCHRFDNLTVLNCSSSSANPVTLEQLCNWFIKENVKDGSNVMPCPTVTLTKHKWLLNLISFFTLTLPACLMDIWLYVRRKPTKYLKLSTRIVALRTTVQYFNYNSWVFKSSATEALYASLPPSDRELFPFDITTIQWEPYISIYIKGINKFLIRNA